MALKNRTEMELISSRKILLKKVGRLRKQLRILKINNASLRNTNREMVLTVQMLKENLKVAETKLKSMHVDLCQSEVMKHTMQENFKKLSRLMPELAMLLHGTSSVVTKIYGVMAESVVQDMSQRESLEEHRLPNLSNLETMADQCHTMNKSSQMAQHILEKVKDLDSCYVEKEKGTQTLQDMPNRILNSSSEFDSSHRVPGTNPTDSVPKKININVTPFQPTVYRLGLNPVLSPVPEQNSQALVEEDARSYDEPSQAVTSVGCTHMNTTISNCIEESTLRNDDASDEEHEEPVEGEEEYEEKPCLLEITKIEYSIEDDQYSQNSDIALSEAEVSEEQKGANDPGYLSNMMSEMSTLPRPESENELPIHNTHIEEMEDPIIESVQSIPAAYLETIPPLNSSTQDQTPNSKFINVFPRKRRAITPLNDTIATPIANGPEVRTTAKDSSQKEQFPKVLRRLSVSSTSSINTPRSSRSQSLKPEGSSGAQKLPLVSNSTLRRSRSLQSLQGSPSVGNRSTRKKKKPTRFSPRLMDKGRQTRKAIKSYKEPSLTKKLRR